MIAKHIKRKPGSRGPFGKLARYIAAASDQGEKLDRFWAVNCNAGDGIGDLDHIANEVEATQSLNTRAKSDKTYHLMVSFRDERPSAEALVDIERRFAEALGFGDHQRVAGTHQNTGNFHMHVAFNRIHPVTRRIHHPKHDYRALERTCRAMEMRHGLKLDRGRADNPKRDHMPAKARDMEVRTWEESFAGYVQKLLPKLDARRAAATSWQDLHAGFGEFGLQLKLRANGLVITDARHKSRRIKASTLSRHYSKPSLEKELGPFEPLRPDTSVQAKQFYERRPNTRHPGQAKLWKKYRAGRRGASAIDKANYRSWRQFIEGEAGNDPLARAIMKAQQQSIQTILGSPGARGRGR